MKNLLFKDWGTWLNTEKGEQYQINKVVIFKDNKKVVIANYFLDNFKDYQMEIKGEIRRKLKEDLTQNINFVVKSEEQDFWKDKTNYTLYINGDLNNYIFDKLELQSDCLQLVYYINDCKCSQCIGWNTKESNKAKYKDFEDAYKRINTYSIDSMEMEKNIKDLLKAYKNYKKAKEIEKTYTIEDYKKMSLVSGTTFEENTTMLKNNNFDITGVKENEK